MGGIKVNWGSLSCLPRKHWLDQDGVFFQLMVEQFKAQDLFTPKLAVYTLGLLGLCFWEVLERLRTLSGTGHILIQLPGLQCNLCDLGTL